MPRNNGMALANAASFWVLCAQLDKVSEHEFAAGAQMFMGRPDRWYETHLWRCPAGHVGSMMLKAEGQGDLCMECHAPVRLTFPEDVDGPLNHPALRDS